MRSLPFPAAAVFVVVCSPRSRWSHFLSLFRAIGPLLSTLRTGVFLLGMLLVMLLTDILRLLLMMLLLMMMTMMVMMMMLLLLLLLILYAEETGWKLVHGDVFRKPSHRMLVGEEHSESARHGLCRRCVACIVLLSPPVALPLSFSWWSCCSSGSHSCVRLDILATFRSSPCSSALASNCSALRSSR
jgi:endomembrane protein 70